MGLLQRSKHWLEHSQHGSWAIGLASYLESTVVPIPLEVILVPYLLARRDRVWRISTIVTLGCLLGALTGYAVGYFLMETVGESLVKTFGWTAGVSRFRTLFDQHGFWAIVAVGVLPIPFQAGMLVSGATGYPIPLFLLASAIARGFRYYGLAALVLAAGDRAERLWQRHGTAIMLAAGAVCLCLLAFSVSQN